MTEKPLLLFVDDREEDVFILASRLEEGGLDFDLLRVDTEAGLLQALSERAVDLAIVDHVIPGFGGPEALAILREHAPDVPTIAVSGLVSEAIVGELLRVGACDYVLKDNPRRFPAAVARALEHREDVLRRREAESRVLRLQHELRVKYAVASICLARPGKDMYAEVLAVLRRELSSPIGLFGYINFRGDLICPSIAEGVHRECSLAGGETVFRKESWAGLWGRALEERRILAVNEPMKVPEGHLPIARALAAPLEYGDQVIGAVMVANKESDYSDEDCGLLQAIAGHISPILHARMETARKEYQRQRALEALQRSQERYRELVQHMGNGVAVYRPTEEGEGFLLVDINEAGCRHSRCERREVVGQSVAAAFPGVGAMGLLDVLRRVSRTGQAEHLTGASYADGTVRDGWFDNFVYRLSTGEVVAVYDDITERVESQRELAESEQRYALAVEGANDAIWDWDLASGRFYFSPRLPEMLGHPRRACPDPEAWFWDQVLPEDGGLLQDALKEYLESSEGHFRAEFRMRGRGGESRWILARAAAVRGVAGTATRLAGSFSDVTARRRAEEGREKALRSAIDRATEMEALLLGSRYTLEEDDFTKVIRQLFDLARQVIGAPGGYAARLSKTGGENEVLFLETGGESCTVDPGLPMPLRGLRADAYRAGRAVSDNDFASSPHAALIPPGHVQLRSVLFAPLQLAGETLGLLGFANKPGGFTRRDERVAEAFAELAAIALRNSRHLEAIRDHTENLEQKVAERTAALNASLEETRAARNRIDGLLQMKEEFISTAAHELKTPLTTLRGFSELLLARDDLSDEERSRFLTYIQNQSLHLSSIVSDLLDLSRIESGIGFQLVLEQADPAAISASVVDEYRSLRGPHRFTLEGEGDGGLTWVDRAKMGQVIRNLLSNAVKYSPDGGEIRVAWEMTDTEVGLAVSDEGIGMTPEQVSRIFEKFYRADSSSTAVEGTGLGMCIVKHIVEAHGGTIQVDSIAGEGTTVRIVLPRQPEGEMDVKEEVR